MTLLKGLISDFDFWIDVRSVGYARDVVRREYSLDTIHV